MKRPIYLFALLLCLGCSTDGDLPPFDIIYEVTFESFWSEISHPNDFPEGEAHFSPMVVLTHQRNNMLFHIDSLATPGIKEMAETGATTLLQQENGIRILRDEALDRAIGTSFDSPGSDKLFIGLTQFNSKVSVVSMIAPSPDWFVGVNNVRLFENGDWLNQLTLDAIPYDAGTDNGKTYKSANSSNLVPENITLIRSGPLATNGFVNRMGTFRFVRIR